MLEGKHLVSDRTLMRTSVITITIIWSVFFVLAMILNNQITTIIITFLSIFLGRAIRDLDIVMQKEKDEDSKS